MDEKSAKTSEDAQNFLARIVELEKTYGMKSWYFQFLYENCPKELLGYNGRSAVDYSEWAFLFENFGSQMNQSSDPGPPQGTNETDQHKPEQCSGLCFSGDNSDQFSSPIS
jgi:hypothetical protein